MHHAGGSAANTTAVHNVCERRIGAVKARNKAVSYTHLDVYKRQL